MVSSNNEIVLKLSLLHDETTPLGIFLVKSDHSDEKLLFRYPYVIENNVPTIRFNQSRYALVIPPQNKPINKFTKQPTINETNASASLNANMALLPAYTELTSTIKVDQHTNDQEDTTKIIGFTDSAFSDLFGAIKHQLCDKKFELKVDNVRFVGHPTLVDKDCFHVVFALKANAEHHVLKSYHELSQHLSIALKSEQARCQYFSRESKIMMTCHDEIGTSHFHQRQVAETNKENKIGAGGQNSNDTNVPSPYESILKRSLLAKELMNVFVQLYQDGIVHVKINNSVNLNFCLPQKMHLKLTSTMTSNGTSNNTSLMAGVWSPRSLTSITPLNIQCCLEKLRPYHTFLLLIDVSELLETLPLDVSPSFVRLIRFSNPLKNLLEISADSDISLAQVFNIVAQLVYWGRATIIFPLCESNVYMLHPSACLALASPLVMEFEQKFPNESFIKFLSRFSLGASLSQFKNPMNSAEQESKFVRIMVWMLRKRILLQLHTYVLFVPSSDSSSRSSPSKNPFHYDKLSTSAMPNNDYCSNESNSSQGDISFGSQATSPSSLSGLLINNHHLDHSFLNSQPSFINNETTESNKNETLVINLNTTSTTTNVAHSLSLKETCKSILLAESNLGSLTMFEIDEILSCHPASDSVDDVRLFGKLLPYFDGQHHIEDMMYYENLRRSQVLTLIDKFRDVLVVCQFEDTTVAQLLPYDALQ